MNPSIRVIPDGFTIRLPNGWEISDRELLAPAVTLLAVVAAAVIWGIVRAINRRDSQSAVKSDAPRDHP